MFDGGRADLASPATRPAVVVLLTEAVLYSASPPVERPGEAGAVRGVGEGGGMMPGTDGGWKTVSDGRTVRWVWEDGTDRMTDGDGGRTRCSDRRQVRGENTGGI